MQHSFICFALGPTAFELQDDFQANALILKLSYPNIFFLSFFFFFEYLSLDLAFDFQYIKCMMSQDNFYLKSPTHQGILPCYRNEKNVKNSKLRNFGKCTIFADFFGRSAQNFFPCICLVVSEKMLSDPYIPPCKRNKFEKNQSKFKICTHSLEILSPGVTSILATTIFW